jgi:N-acetylglucosamine-1-phosphodiester alpha-N-acetylglucosaminidase
VQGNVTIFVGVTEYPLGKFHFYPSPRDEDSVEDISLLHRGGKAAQMYSEQQAKARRSPSRFGHPITGFLELEAKLNPLCDGVATTSASAQAYGCLLAMNAGFFNMATGACLGNVVSNDQLINVAAADLQHHSHFGLTRDNNFITGYLTPEQVQGGVDGGFHELAQGSGWLIRDGKNYINVSMVTEGLGSGFVEEKAPRNAVGHDKDGRLLIFEADGEEDIKLGLTLYEFADILATHFNVENAINVDGGGSSTTVYKGEVVDKPTCRDTPQMCERAVTTISCVMA